MKIDALTFDSTSHINQMSSLLDLCLNYFVTSGYVSIWLLDRVPYELYVKYRQKKLDAESKQIPPIVSCLILSEIHHLYFHTWYTQKSIILCIMNKVDACSASTVVIRQTSELVNKIKNQILIQVGKRFCKSDMWRIYDKEITQDCEPFETVKIITRLVSLIQWNGLKN